MHFILSKKVKKLKLQPNEKLISFDVEALFPSIPIDTTLDLLDEWLRINEPDDNKRLTYVKATKFCMKSNFCQFNNKFYHITDGISMGNAFSPFMANIFMSNFEMKLFGRDELPRIWWRCVRCDQNW